MRWLAVLLVLGVIGHPFRPAHFAAYVKGAMPLEPPQLLDRHMPHGVIHENTLNAAVVSVKGEMFHFMSGSLPITVVVAGHEFVGATVMRPAAAPHHVHEHRDLVQVVAGGIDRAPMPILFSALYVPRRVVEPVVVAITRTRRNGLPRDPAVLEGGIPTADRVPRISLVLVHRF